MSDSRKQLKSPRKVPDDSDISEREEEPSELNSKPLKKNPSTNIKPQTISPMRKHNDDAVSEKSGASPTRRGTSHRQDSSSKLPIKSDKSSTRDKDRKNRSPDRDRNRSRKDGPDRDGKDKRDPSVSFPLTLTFNSKRSNGQKICKLPTSRVSRRSIPPSSCFGSTSRPSAAT